MLSRSSVGTDEKSGARLYVMAGLVAIVACACSTTSALAGFVEGRSAYYAKDYKTAYAEFREAADQGHARAQFRLGLMSRRGQGVKKDLAEGARWYQKAADQGHAMAQYNLGNAYRAGLGVRRNWVEAYMWFSLFAAQRPNDQRNWVLGDMEEYMTPMQVVEAKERAKNWQPGSGK